ncbi:MAG: hypothetical protein HFJ54_00600 [Clostridia bacterium]|nr:hypothetical protein [Clostridia bacterium]
MATKVRTENLEQIKEELDRSLVDCDGAPSHIICKIVLYVLDTAQKQKRINGLERMAALDYLEKAYGFYG